ncbi:Clp protease N-terminal domain-containing protein [Mycobacterium xenopi]|uniref:Clp protease N-terminal domain-containing protein n=1 Tax=Mycobacterium xenopi TaxID=1789 RepID=UPI000A160211|nr:Clp protease N-terminal domain-containing protein [Mycobacterium xenopi]MDA3639524.1 Clp protease [Mycobacterium xenopi]MDA3657761.1 Clp protease [Mycobacterium xenopi]MDA3663315.1 Clp protease [Mycobacterium xenopi]ORX20348.1 Clp protease [Mycobacterium xenopi]SPX90312.1 Clp N terminal domain-containing protein [Mycobacterium xenopi]
MVFERFSRNARVAVVLAHEEARELGCHEIGAEHLLLGVVQAADHDLSALLDGYGLTADVIRARLAEKSTAPDESFQEDAEALRAIGIDLDAVRDAVARTFGRDAFAHALPRSGRRRRPRGHTRFTRPAKKALELALREALAHNDNVISCEHMLLGILRGGDKTAIGLITEHVYTAQLRAAIIALLDKAA